MTIRYRLVIDVEYDQPDPKEVEDLTEQLTERVTDVLEEDVFRPFGDEHVSDIKIRCRKFPSAYEEVIDLPIRQTDMSNHLKAALKRGFDIRQVRELEQLTEERVRAAVSGPLSVRNFGDTALKELLRWAERHFIEWSKP